MFKTKYRVVHSAKTALYYIQQRSFFTAFIWVFVGMHPDAGDFLSGSGYITTRLAEEAIELLQLPKFVVVNKE